jgi:tetratricopeptide (TPR) repeat protein
VWTDSHIANRTALVLPTPFISLGWPGLHAMSQGLLAKALRITSGSAYRAELLHAAAETFRAAIALGAVHESAHVGLGQALLERARGTRDAADVERAVDALVTAVALAPRHAHSQSTLSAALQLANRPMQALEAAAAAAAADQLSVAAHNNHGLLLAALGRHTEAIQQAYAVGLRLDPRNAETLCNIADSTADLGEYRSAASIFAAALESDPTHARAQANLDTVIAYLESLGR